MPIRSLVRRAASPTPEVPVTPSVPKKALRKIIKNIEGVILGEMTEEEWKRSVKARRAGTTRRGRQLYSR